MLVATNQQIKWQVGDYALCIFQTGNNCLIDIGGKGICVSRLKHKKQRYLFVLTNLQYKRTHLASEPFTCKLKKACFVCTIGGLFVTVSDIIIAT